MLFFLAGMLEKHWNSLCFWHSRPAPPSPKTMENDGYSKTMENLWKSMHFQLLQLMPELQAREASSWGPRILRKAYWKSLEFLVFLAAQTCGSTIRTRTTAKEPWENDGYSKAMQIQ